MLIYSATQTSNVSEVAALLSFLMIFGFFVGKLFFKIKVPEITGYLIAGLLITVAAPFAIEIYHDLIKNSPITYEEANELYHNRLNGVNIISQLALGIISFQIGTELWLGRIMKSGKQIFIITICQALITAIFVFIGVYLLNAPLPLALILGAIATATAPAPIIEIVKKYKSSGELTDTLVPVVGLDDAVGVIIFGFIMSIAVPMYNGMNTFDSSTFIYAIKDVVLSIFAGAIIGLICGQLENKIENNYEKNSYNIFMIIVAVLFAVSMANLLHLSTILTPMVAGAVLTNLIDKVHFEDIEEAIHEFKKPIIISFFTIAGMHLDIFVFAKIELLLIIVGYIILRSVGKIFGAYFGARISKAPSNVKKYLGLTLLPQSGVAIGLSQAAQIAIGGSEGDKLNSIVLAGVLVFALVGPILVRTSLIKSGDISKENYEAIMHHTDYDEKKNT